MDKNCPNNLCTYTYKPKKKPFKCPDCDAYIGEWCDIPCSHIISHVWNSKSLDFVPFIDFVGGKFVPTVVKKKKTEKVFNLGNGYYSVHTNQIYRTVCHVPSGMMTKYCISASVDYYIQGMPPSCAFKACIVEKELCERNNADFTCSHIEEIRASAASDPEDELLLDDLRS